MGIIGTGMPETRRKLKPGVTVGNAFILQAVEELIEEQKINNRMLWATMTDEQRQRFNAGT